MGKTVYGSKSTYQEIQKRVKNMNRLKNEEERFRRMGDLRLAFESEQAILDYAKSSRLMTNMFKQSGIFTEHFNRLIANNPQFKNDMELQNKLKQIYSKMKNMSQFEFQKFYDENKDILTDWMNFYEQQKSDPIGQDYNSIKAKIDEMYSKIMT